MVRIMVIVMVMGEGDGDGDGEIAVIMKKMERITGMVVV